MPNTNNENKNVINAILSIFSTRVAGPGQLFLSVFAILAIVIFVIGLPLTTVILNYNQVRNTNSIQENLTNLSITETTLITLQDYLKETNEIVANLQRRNEELRGEILLLKSTIIILENTDLTEDEVKELLEDNTSVLPDISGHLETR